MQELLVKVGKGWDSVAEELDFWFDAAHIEGTVPVELRGTFFRNGPGVSEVYGHKLLHPIDGDGMVCALSFDNGRVHFRSRFVRTSRRVAETEAKAMLFRGQMGSNPASLKDDLVSIISSFSRGEQPHFKYRAPANTNAFYWGGKLLACYETILPHCLDPVSLATIGSDDLNGALSLGAFAAHFRVDSRARTDDDVLATLSLRPGIRGSPPALAFCEFDRDWNLLKEQTQEIEGMNYAHDFMLTPNYYILHMTPFVKIDTLFIMKAIAGLSSPGESMQYYPDMPSRFVFIPRVAVPAAGVERTVSAAPDSIVQLDTEPCHIFHFGNVLDRGDGRIDFEAVCLGENFNMEFQHKVWLSNAGAAPGLLHHYAADLRAGTLRRWQTDSASCEFPSVHPQRHVQGRDAGEGARFTYLMGNDRGGNLPYIDVVKHDTKGSQRGVWRANGCVGEPVFVPRSRDGAEDDGWVVVQMYDPDLHRTEFVILCARQMSEAGLAGAEPLCRLRLDSHVPYGFHGTFTPDVVYNDEDCAHREQQQQQQRHQGSSRSKL